MFYFWWGMAAILMLAELLIPGLVVVFVGLGAATVALLMHYRYIDGIVEQFLTWFVSSLIYCFTLRFLVLRFYKSDKIKENIDEDQHVFGQRAQVRQTIPAGGVGRIYHADTTWQARSSDGTAIVEGEQVRIVGRENITWIVEKN